MADADARSRGWEGLVAWGSGRILGRLWEQRGRDVRLVELDGVRRVASLGAYSDAELDWELDLRDDALRNGVGLPNLVPALDGRRRVGSLVVVEEVAGEPPSSEADWAVVGAALRWLHQSMAGRPQRPGRAAAGELADGAATDDLEVRGLPPEVLEVCRAAWSRVAAWPRTVVVGDSHVSNIRMTAAGPVFLDWSAAHVDAPELDLAVLPSSATPLEGRALWLAVQAVAASTAARSWTTDTARAQRQLDRIDWP